jgi:hypothetical protein
MVTVFGDLFLRYKEHGQPDNALFVLHLAGLTGFEYHIICYIETSLAQDEELEEHLEDCDYSPDDYDY